MKIGSILFITTASVLLFLAACERPPELPSVPFIEFENVEYKPFPNRDKPDSVIFTIGFEDNEGDLGANLTAKDESPTKFYPTDINGKYITLGSSPELPPYNECDYDINPTINGVVEKDTVYTQIDPNFHNMLLTFFIKVKGTFQEFDFRTQSGPSIYCQSINARFLRLNTKPNDRPLKGSLRYGMTTFVFGRTIRDTDTLQVQIQIRDNAFNYSNIVTTPEFTLAGVTKE